MKYKFVNKKNIINSLSTIFVFFVVPLLFTYIYVQKLTINQFTPSTTFEMAAQSSSSTYPLLVPQPINISSSSPSHSIKTQPTVVTNFDQAAQDLSFFNIQPNIIKYSIYLGNFIQANMTYKDVGSSTEQSGLAISKIDCNGNIIESGDKKDLIKSGLILSTEPANDRLYIDEIIRTCVSKPAIEFDKNTGPYIFDTVSSSSIEVLKGSGINLIIEPTFISMLIIYIGFFIFWTAFIILLREGPMRFYKKR